MAVTEKFAIAAFRSRSAVQKLEAELRRRHVPCSVISTPRDVSIGCGLSLRFDLSSVHDAVAAYRQVRPPTLIGFYIVERSGGRTTVSPISVGLG